MAIVNRDLDVSERKAEFSFRLSSLVKGASGIVAPGSTHGLLVVPYASELESVRTWSQGCSGGPILSFFKSVYISGSGQTGFAMGVSGIPLVNFASIGVQGQSILPASGSTQIQLNAGDVILVNNATGAATDVVGVLVLKKLQDIVTTNGQQ